jgi:Glycosyltransferase family 87
VTATRVRRVSGARHAERLTRERAFWLATTVALGALSVSAVVVVFQNAVESDTVAFDFHQFYSGAKAILRGESPYLPGTATAAWGGPYPYPPLPALVAAPLTVLSFETAGLLVMATLVVVALATLYVLDVRDWRCYGVALLWQPVISAIQTGNLTLWFGLAAALSWRFRDRLLPSSVSIGVMLATKFFLWPLVVWLAATRRIASACLACATGAALLLASWAVIGFAGMLGYPALLRRLEAAVGEDSYTAYIVGLDIGLPSAVARALWLAIGFGLLASVVLLARRGDERSAFIAAVAASLALTPIVWLHYFALLLVVVAVAQPRLGLLWFCPLALIVTPGSGHPTPFQTAWTLGVAAIVVSLSIRTSMARVSCTEPERARLAEVVP